MEESALNIQQMSIGSMAGILNELNKESFLVDLPLMELLQTTNEFRSLILKPHQIQSFQLEFNEESQQFIQDKIEQKFKLGFSIINYQNEINRQYLVEYHKYEKNIIIQVENLEKDDLQAIENCDDQMIEWHHQLTTKFNSFTSLKLFYYNKMNIIYSEDLYTRYQNQDNLVKFQKGLFKICSIAVQEEFEKIKSKYQFKNDYSNVENIKYNIELAKSYIDEQNYIEDLIDFLGTKLIFDITQIVKNSLMNIDKISNYLNKLAYKHLIKDLNKKFKDFEAQEATMSLKVIFQKIKHFTLPKTLDSHQQLYKAFNEINHQLHDIIQRNRKYSEYPKAVQRILRKLFDYFFKGNRKFIKLKIRYLQIAQLFEESQDKMQLLSSKTTGELEKLQYKANVLQNFMVGLFDMGEICLYCYDYAEQLNTFIFQISILVHHYSELMTIMGGSNKSSISTRPKIRKIFEPYPEEEKAILNNKYSLVQLSRVEQSQQQS